MKKMLRWAGVLGAVTAAFQGCEPSTVTEAREQLGRNPGVVSFVVPIADTTYLVSDLLASAADTITTASGLLGVRVQADTVDAFSYVGQLTTRDTSTTVAFPSPGVSGAPGAPGGPVDTLRFESTQGSPVTAAVIGSGFVSRASTNTTGCTSEVTVSLTDSTGASVLAFGPDTLFDGTSRSDVLSVAGRSMRGYLVIATGAVFLGGCVPNPAGSVASDIDVSALTLSSVSLVASNETITVDGFAALDADELGLDDLDDAIRESQLNDATIDLVVANTADIPVVLTGATLGLVRTTNGVLDSVGGAPAYEEDANGFPILVLVADPGGNTLSIPRRGTAAVTVQAAPLVDRMVDILLDGDPVAVLAAGAATAGDGLVSVLTDQDEVEIRIDASVALDFTIPLVGVTLDRNQVADGMDLDSADADDLAERLISAVLVAEVGNSTPFGIEIDIALAGDSLDENADVFALPGAVLLEPVILSAPSVNPVGVPTGTVSDSVSLTITGSDSRVVLGQRLTAGLRIRLVPRSGGGTRGAVLPTSGLDVDSRVVLRVRQGSGGTP